MAKLTAYGGRLVIAGRTLCDGAVLADRETTLREDTLGAFVKALASGTAPPIDTRVYAVLDQAYRRTGSAR